jgi:MATE family multidrug resistance protein
MEPMQTAPEIVLPKHNLKSLLSLAWPVIISRSTQVVVGLADAVMVAHLGQANMAAVTAGALNSVAFFILPMGIVFIVSSFSSQLAGRGDAVAARRYGWYGLGLAGLAQLLMLATLPFLPSLLGHLNYAPEVHAAMGLYLHVRLLSTGFVVGLEALGNYYAGLGNTSIMMKANIVAMSLAVLLNWLLIDGHCGFPAMGVAGAAWACVFSVGTAFLGLLGVFLWQGRSLEKPKLKLAEFTRMLRFGLPSGLNWSFEFFAFIAFVNVVVASLGTTSLAALMSVIQVNSVAFMPAFGLSTAGAILVGQSIGAGKKDDVGGIVKLTLFTAAGWMGLVSIVYLLFPQVVLHPFTSPGTEAEFMAVAVKMLMLSACWQLFDATGITMTETLRAAGDTAWAMWARGILAWLVFLPGAWFSVNRWGGKELSAMAWLLTYLVLLSLALTLRFRSGAWRKVQLVEHELPV